MCIGNSLHVHTWLVSLNLKIFKEIEIKWTVPFLRYSFYFLKNTTSYLQLLYIKLISPQTPVVKNYALCNLTMQNVWTGS